MATACVRSVAVESFLRATRSQRHASAAVKSVGAATFIIDPPRTGTSKEAVNGIIEQNPQRMVYVSCDVATLARDTRKLIDAGYELQELTGMDLFPNTAHIETIALLQR